MNQPQIPLKVLLIGDNCIDEYHYGSVNRINPEAPVPIFAFDHKDERPGMAANVAENLKALGCQVHAQLGSPSTKIRLIDSRSRQHITRIDYDVYSNAINPEKGLDVDVVVISDYNKGAVSEETILTALYNYQVPVIIDTKKTDLRQFEGCIVKINDIEYRNLKSKCANLIVTHGKDPVTFRDVNYTVPKQEVVDVCGAGDTFLAAFAYQFALTYNFDTAIKFAIRASSITVQHIGVYAPTLEEINEN